MELTPTQISALQNLTVNTTKIDTESLRVGQQLLAKVIATNSTTGEVTLNINNALLNAKSNIPLSNGQTIQLIVAQMGKELLLQLPQSLIEQAITQKTLRQSLPEQQSQSETLKSLEYLAQQGKKAGISHKVIQFTQNFLQQLPNGKQLSQAQNVKDIIQRSGIFFENKLSNINSKITDIQIKTDFKSFLLQLKSLLIDEKKLSDSTTIPNNQSKTAPPNTQKIDAKIIDLVKQINTAEESNKLLDKKISSSGSTQQDVKTALQLALNKINQQQASISKNISRLLGIMTTSNASSPTNTSILGQSPKATGLNSPNMAKTTNTALSDALGFTTNSQKTDQPDINFSRLNNLMELLDKLIKQVDAGISRTQLHQLNSLIEPEGGKLSWSMEIPVKIDDELHSIHLHLEKEPNASNDAEAVLTVNIALDLKKLGPIYARITLIADNVGVVLWAEREDTYQLTQQHADHLENNFYKSGLKPENINFHHGQPPQKSVLNKTQKSAIVDVKV